MRGNRGFTLIEVIVVAAIIAILAGILVPMIFNQIDEAKNARAQADCKSISSAILLFRRDTGKWPYYVPAGNCTTETYTTIQGGGTVPPTDNTVGAWGVLKGTDVALDYILNLPGALPVADQTCYNDKAKNYMSSASPDPWGKQYVVNAANFADATKPVWVISAGPNGCIDTSIDSPILNDAVNKCGQADDIGIRIQ